MWLGRRLAVVALATGSLACPGKAERPAERKTLATTGPSGAAPHPSGIASRRVVTPVAASRFFALGTRACVGAPGHDVSCGTPRERRGDAGRALALTFKPVLGTARLVETAGTARLVNAAVREECFRTADGVASCSGREVARGVKSVAGAPYLLLEDGTVVVARGADATSASIDALRERAVKRLPPLERLVATDHATCGLSRSAEVWCWPEPAYWFNEMIEAPIEPRPTVVPGLTDVVDVMLMPWLTLCARTRAGAVRCSAPPARATDVCTLHGKSDVRCGPQTTGPKGPPGLSGAGYDPRRVLERPLVPVPGLDGSDPATTLGTYARIPYHMLESGRRIFVGDFDEGGCARLASGGVRCWERDLCSPRTPWRSASVEGLPPKIARVALGASDGYALTEDGALYTWARRPDRQRPADCATAPGFTLRAMRVDVPEPVVDVGGGTFAIEMEPMFAGVDCVVLASGKLTCTRTDGVEKTPVDVALGE